MKSLNTTYSQIIVLTSLLIWAGSVKAANVSGLIDIVARDVEEEDFTNLTFRGYSNFHTSRARLFFDAALGDNSAAFVQLLMDDGDISLYGAYARFEKVGSPFFNVQVGILPTTVGTFAARTYSNVNPLIGSPLIYNYHSSFHPSGSNPIGDVDDLIASRDARSNFGLPIIYDACWNSGVELFGTHKKFSYSIAALAGSPSKPLMEQKKNIPQLTSRISYAFDPGLILGVSGYVGPYLYEGSYSDPLPADKSYENYMNSGAGYDFYFARGHLEIYSEGFYTVWQYPTLPDLVVMSGYLEAEYTFLPQWYVAGRGEIFLPDEVTLTSGGSERWDYEVRRYEFGLGHNFSRTVIGKLVGQLNRFPEAPAFDNDLYAFQLSMSFH